MSVEAILRQVDELTADERRQLFERLHARYPAVEMTPELAALLDEREAAYLADPSRVFTLDESIARARAAR